jgi:hypothetical protein
MPTFRDLVKQLMVRGTVLAAQPAYEHYNVPLYYCREMIYGDLDVTSLYRDQTTFAWATRDMIEEDLYAGR